MKKIKHSKFKNTGFLFELLTRQITLEILNNSPKEKAKRIVQEFFGGKTQLAKELKLYNLLINEKYNSEINAFADNFIESLVIRPAYSKGNAIGKNLSINKKKKSLNNLLEIYTEEVVEKGIVASSGGHLGYIPGGGIFTSALADYIADVTNEYAGIHFGSPGAVTLENELLNWMKNIFGFPKDAIGNLASGGSIANLIALTAARDKHKVKNEKIQKSVVYLSPQTHHCIHKALRIIGLEDVIIRNVELDNYHKIDVDKLEHLIKTDFNSGLHPFLVIASAGTTDTGAVDPLDEIGTISKKYNLLAAPTPAILAADMVPPAIGVPMQSQLLS